MHQDKSMIRGMNQSRNGGNDSCDINNGRKHDNINRNSYINNFHIENINNDQNGYKDYKSEEPYIYCSDREVTDPILGNRKHTHEESLNSSELFSRTNYEYSNKNNVDMEMYNMSNNNFYNGNNNIHSNDIIDYINNNNHVNKDLSNTANNTDTNTYIKKLTSNQSTAYCDGNGYNESVNGSNFDINFRDAIKNNNNKSYKNNINNNHVHDDMLELGDRSFDSSFYMHNNVEETDNERSSKLSFMSKLKMYFNYFGPGWIVAIAYLDPGNICGNLNVGLIRSADFNNADSSIKDYTGYRLLWVLVYGHIIGFIFHTLSMKLGHITGLDLAALCRKEFSSKFSYFLYICVQIAIWGAHLQAIIGVFVAINLILGIPVKIAILYTLIEAFAYSFLENKSLDLLEKVLSLLIGILVCCFMFNVFMTPINFQEVASSILYPRIPKGKLLDTMGLLGSVISAHIFYLHSNLTSKKKPVIYNDRMVKRYNKLGTIESGGSLLVSCITNCIIVLTFAEVNISGDDRKADYNLFNAYDVMKKYFGKTSMYIWSFGLLSSGNNASFMCEYASKSVFEGFLNKNVNPFFRVIFSRIILFIMLYAYVSYDKYTIDQLSNFINVVQILLLPLAIIPLYRFSIHKNVLGKFAIKGAFKYLVFVLVISIIVANFLLTLFDFLQYAPSNLYVMLIFICSIFYLLFIIYFFNIPITKTYYKDS
ncbi:transporter, putative [Plasmodium berghei]|uniref:Divalent metal transporter, putative n=2 Tax=Plasmodium berghei TaxID=5821 RepID=A0A509AP85_PLABA|nr:divalent metal transporter, putative [Plasmodium berghei ANKA]CXI82498.1 transporter, putative [Plasmodium berghei]SCM25633.1 transporter, putative [Plasmodium berghei]SCN27428.1 transporter, putative [Plasmodium berghei]SCO62118.1 transporter, putative [Plasmodium berghei]SCO63855.1 transporter, putative [Plasmodium berghei]|eukprot:XP_034423060.1 divalent metal transporter, putative [Plasmodium berghei ANKA]